MSTMRETVIYISQDEDYEAKKEEQLKIILQDLTLSPKALEELDEDYDFLFRIEYQNAVDLQEKNITLKKIRQRTALSVGYKLGLALIGEMWPYSANIPIHAKHGIRLLERIINTTIVSDENNSPNGKYVLWKKPVAAYYLYLIYSGRGKNRIYLPNVQRANELVELLEKEIDETPYGQRVRYYADYIKTQVPYFAQYLTEKELVGLKYEEKEEQLKPSYEKQLRELVSRSKEKASTWSEWGLRQLRFQRITLVNCFGPLYSRMAGKQKVGDVELLDLEKQPLLPPKKLRRFHKK